MAVLISSFLSFSSTLRPLQIVSINAYLLLSAYLVFPLFRLGNYPRTIRSRARHTGYRVCIPYYPSSSILLPTIPHSPISSFLQLRCNGVLEQQETVRHINSCHRLLFRSSYRCHISSNAFFFFHFISGENFCCVTFDILILCFPDRFCWQEG